MSLTKRQISKLNKIIIMAQQLLATADSSASKRIYGRSGRPASGRGGKVRQRRSSAEAAKMRADILAKRARGVAAATLAEKYGVSTAYIYMIK
jgi:hypothetical protein